MTAAEALRAAIPRLRAAGIEDPAGDARRLLAHALGIVPDRLTLSLSDEMTEPQARGFEEAIVARAARQPVAQIIGERAFWGFPFRVTPDTLDPRPETETLVEEALRAPFERMLDLGTGTGCILIACLLETGRSTGLGLDASAAALAVAAGNARRLGVADRAGFTHKSWLDPDWHRDLGRFDLVASNPPYIAEAEMSALAPEVRDWEPRLALTPGGDGLAAYRAIAAAAPALLAPGGRLLLETGPTQGRAVAALLQAQGLSEVRLLPDLDSRDRVVAARAPA